MIRPRSADDIGRRGGQMVTRSARASRAAIVLLVVMAGCGGQDAQPPATTGALTASQFEALTRELAGAGTQGQVSPDQAAVTAKRQAQIARTHAGKLGAGRCRTALEHLSSAYITFGDAAGSLAADRGGQDAYAKSAAAVSTSLQDAKQDCV
jgi:hypothetical protein